jgi:hypothetical protein
MIIMKTMRIRCTGYVARIRKDRNTWKVLVGKPERERPPGRSRCRWEDHIRMVLKEIG